MANNLTSTEIKKWKNNVDKAISTNLVNSLKKANEAATQLNKVTASGQDENNLSYRYNDLKKVTNQAAGQLTTFMKSFDTSLETYIKIVKDSESATAEKARKSIDQFAEAASKIAKLKM